MNISRATAQGQRRYQEDRSVVSSQEGGKLVAVMDGHSGAGVSHRLATMLPRVWRKRVSELKTLGLVHDWIPVVIKSVFADLASATAYLDEGSTLSLVFIPTAANEHGDRVIHVAILGDSPVIIYDDINDRVDVSPVHNARSNPTELLAAQARGAFFNGNYIFRGYGGPGIQMTRVLGDRELSDIVNREPEIYSRVIGSRGFVLIGSDGLFDPSNRNLTFEVEKVMTAIQAGADAEDLVQRALAIPENGDNVTAVLIRFERKKGGNHGKSRGPEKATGATPA
jgi:serine/threonine protein phosphatase PrpC